MNRGQKLFTFIFAASMCFFSSCKTSNNSPTGAAADTNYLYLSIRQNNPSCPLTLTLSGPTTFQDVLGKGPLLNSLIAFDYVVGNYSFYFNGVTDGVLHNLSGPETISCSPTLTTSCSNWSYSVGP